MPNVDQDTGGTFPCTLRPTPTPLTAYIERHRSEPDQTMRSYRNIDEGHKNGACLGMQLVAAKKEGIIRTGDSVVVLETGAHHYILQ